MIQRFSILLCIILFLTNCEVDTNVLSESQKMSLVEKMAKAELDSTRTSWHLACEENFDSVVAVTVDSLITAYMKDYADSVYANMPKVISDSLPE